MQTHRFWRILTAVPRRFVVAAAWVALSGVLAAAQPDGGVAAQRAAMQKLEFLAGHWSGPVSITRGPGEPLRLTQTEQIEYSWTVWCC